MWRVIVDMYSKARSSPFLDGVVGGSFPILQGVAQGCPLSPILFNVQMDSLIAETQAKCQADGIPLGGPGENLSTSAFADDLTHLSGTYAGMQRGISAIHDGCRMRKMKANVGKLFAIAFNPLIPQTNSVNPPADHRFRWGDAPIPYQTSTKLLGVQLTDVCTWTAHTKYALQKGWNAFHAWKHMLRDPTLTGN